MALDQKTLPLVSGPTPEGAKPVSHPSVLEKKKEKKKKQPGTSQIKLHLENIDLPLKSDFTHIAEYMCTAEISVTVIIIKLS